MKGYDVAILGAGLAGLQVSRLLTERGLQVLLIDRKPALTHAVHTTGIFVRRTLQDFPLPEDCLGPVVRDVTLYSPGRRRLALHSKQDEFRIGRMGPLYERFLEQAIRAGVEWRPATRFAGCDVSGEQMRIALDHLGVRRFVETRYLVGADGANSKVAAALDLDQNCEWIVGLEDVLEDVPLDGPPRFHCFLDPKLAPGYLCWAVHDGEQVHVGVGGYPVRFEPVDALNEFRASLNGILDLSNARLIERRGGRIPVGGVLRRIANSKGLLLGDAAGAVSPLTAGGLDPCMRLSQYAAEVIVDYLRTGDQRAISAYSGELFRARFVSRLWMRRMIAKIQSPTLIEIGCGFMRLPILRRFAQHVFFGRGSFPDVSYTSHATRDCSLAPPTATSTV